MTDEQPINSSFDMNNPNPGYSNPQIPMQSIRGRNPRGESVNVPENPKKGDVYFDLQKKVFRTFTSQYLEDENIFSFNYWAPNFDYIKGQYVLDASLGSLYLYECTVDHTSGSNFAVDAVAGKRSIETKIINRWQPEYGNYYCLASKLSESIPSGVLHKVPLEDYETNDGFSLNLMGSITIHDDGLHQIIALAKFSAGDMDRHLWIYKNGVAIQDIAVQGDYYTYQDPDGGFHTVQISKTQALQLSWLERCEKNDIIDIYVRQNSSGALTVDSFLQVYKQTW